MRGSVFDHFILQMSALFYQFIIKMGNSLQTIFLLYMRLTWGFLIFLIGMHKVQNMEQTIQFFSDFNIHYPSFHAHLVAWFEILCGALFILGLASRLIAIPLIVIMITALSTAHSADLSQFQFLKDPTSLVNQPPYPYLVTAILMFIFGPGKISFDAWIKRKIQQNRR